MEIVATSSCRHALAAVFSGFSRSAAHNPRHSGNLVQEAFRKMNGTRRNPEQTCNLTLPSLLNKVPKPERTLVKISS
jgi:hypothetical protein